MKTQPSQPALPIRTQRAVEPADAVHVLAVRRLLLLAHTVHVVAGDLCVLGRAEAREAHDAVDVRVEVCVVGVFGTGGGAGCLGGGWFGTVCVRVRFGWGVCCWGGWFGGGWSSAAAAQGCG